MAAVLVVEHDPITAQFLRRALELGGHEAEVVDDPDAAEAALAARRYDVVILDLVVRGGNGFELVRYIRRAHRDGPRILVLSGQRQDAIVRRALAAGADDYVFKPFSPSELLERIADHPAA